MKKIMILGALGQIGTELVTYLSNIYGKENILATNRSEKKLDSLNGVRFEKIDVLDAKKIHDVAKNFHADTIINLAAILSAKGETMPQTTWKINVDGVYNTLEVARELGLKVFIPSSIAAFGEGTPLNNTPQLTVQRPSTIYGITKVTGELLCDYYFKKYGVDTRGVRYPGIISYATLPGSGTTDYAVHIYYDAVKKHQYTSYIDKGTKMDMLYMPDALKAVVDLMEADPNKLITRNAFNITSMSIAPEDIEESIKKYIPDFKLNFDVDPIRQSIAESWPNSLDDTNAKNEWGWNPEYNLDKMTLDMLINIEKK